MSMQYDVMREEDWGRDNCPHANMKKELADGIPTGNMLCEQCGRVLSPEEAASIQAIRQEELLRFE